MELDREKILIIQMKSISFTFFLQGITEFASHGREQASSYLPIYCLYKGIQFNLLYSYTTVVMGFYIAR